ncbi:hypothetical protein [Candidatus Absconditicoccus praedator]|uniref:hypothetical protein n=1 Tax=Candidatus Absconditicoccus praedator TaxID=2735562 RepID=UPI001E34D631|nr:hypothetical protein [Candidatus Absconditicoccus praedator]UFX83108.1 hypothetical protein HLG78_03165 [Candidatus Absconditicoccus praedator]
MYMLEYLAFGVGFLFVWLGIKFLKQIYCLFCEFILPKKESDTPGYWMGVYFEKMRYDKKN